MDDNQLIIGSLPSAHSLTAELDCWQMKWDVKDSDPPNSVTRTLRKTSPVMYPNVYTMLKLCATLPVTSCECECPFSMIKQLKTHIRCTMVQERLCGLALMNIHRDYRLLSAFILQSTPIKQRMPVKEAPATPRRILRDPLHTRTCANS